MARPLSKPQSSHQHTVYNLPRPFCFTHTALSANKTNLGDCFNVQRVLQLGKAVRWRGLRGTVNNDDGETGGHRREGGQAQPGGGGLGAARLRWRTLALGSARDDLLTEVDGPIT